MKEDNELIAAYLEGDEQALGVLVDRYLSDVYSFALRLAGDAGAAEDIAQEAFIKAWKHIRSFVPGRSFRAWLFTIARNTAVDYLRTKKEVALSCFENIEGENTLIASIADNVPLPDELIARAQDVRYLARLLTEINPEYREVIELRHTSNLTFEEIGEVVKRPLHTVKSQHRRGLAALRRLIGPSPA
jgi:RNA polymerase sigma-70 factor (ECF subfamily)